MLKGIHLTLLVGPGVPVPVPEIVLDALLSVEVRDPGGPAPRGFTLEFALEKRSPLQTIFLLTAGSLPPILRTILVVTLNGTPEVIFDGVITRQEVKPAAGEGPDTLSITGVDLTTLMDRIDFSGTPFPAMPPEARVALILAKYAMFGIVPMVIPRLMTEVPIPTQEIPRQQGKDLPYIKHLADEAGYVFYLTPGPVPGMSLAYWGPEIKVGLPQKALNVNMDAYTNVESLSFQINTDQRRQLAVMVQLPIAHVSIPIPIPDVSLLNPPLGLVPPPASEYVPLTNTARLNPIRATLMGLSEQARSADAVTATGSLHVTRYGGLLKGRQLVGVRGAGLAFDGLYYVKSVTHQMKRGEYKQAFTLTRNGLISTLPVVPS